MPMGFNSLLFLCDCEQFPCDSGSPSYMGSGLHPRLPRYSPGCRLLPVFKHEQLGNLQQLCQILKIRLHERLWYNYATQSGALPETWSYHKWVDVVSIPGRSHHTCQGETRFSLCFLTHFWTNTGNAGKTQVPNPNPTWTLNRVHAFAPSTALSFCSFCFWGLRF